VSPRARVGILVAVVAVAAAGLTVGITVLTADQPPKAVTGKVRPGAPPLLLDLGVRIDREARALRQASRLYAQGRRAEARELFERSSSLQAQLGATLSRWPDDSLRALNGLALSNPRSSIAQLHLGLGLYWSGRPDEAVRAWTAAARLQPDTASAVSANDLLHPNFPRGLPAFVPSFPPPKELDGLSPPRQLEVLRRRAGTGDARARLVYGVALQRLGKPISAKRQYAAAARKAPDDAETLVAAAVGRFTKANPTLAFSRLGPLSRRFPHAATVRFHLGLLLLWLGKVAPAKAELRLAVRDDPHGLLGQEARKLLKRLAAIGTR
jgi:tetratricopeptide (TPR) repeat protein